jgi:biopolymer transport protein ExbB/TolQ
MAESRKEDVLMKRTLFVLMIAIFVSTLVGCEQAQQALDTVDKAKAFKDDIEKKAKDVADKAKDFIPGSSGKSQGDKEKKDGEQGSEKGGAEKND